MPPRQVEVRVRQLPAMAVLDLTGDITSGAVEQLRAAYEEAIVADPAAVLLHLGAVEYINSTGIAVLVGLLARARREHRRMYACGLSPHYREIFEVTRLADYLLVFDDEDAAAASLAPSA